MPLPTRPQRCCDLASLDFSSFQFSSSESGFLSSFPGIACPGKEEEWREKIPPYNESLRQNTAIKDTNFSDLMSFCKRSSKNDRIKEQKIKFFDPATSDIVVI